MSNRNETSSSNPEVAEKAKRRRFDAAYKLRVLEEADRCSEPGLLGELLRREGLYSSHLTTWRRQRDAAASDALGPKNRGRKPIRNDAVALENQRLTRENLRLAERLRQAEVIIEVQKKISEMLGISTAKTNDDGRNGW